MTIVEKILKEQGPLISSELAIALSKKENIKLNSASQRVSRAKEIIQIKGFFKSNQSLCYLPEHTKDKKLLLSMTKAMFEQGRKYWFTFNALKMHDGIISKKYLECYTNYPIIPLKKHLPFVVVMKKFVEAGLLNFTYEEYLFSPKFNAQIPNQTLHKTIELLKDNILEDFHKLAKNIGLISYNTGESFAEFGKFRWGFKGLSPVLGLRDNGKFGFLLADILIGTPFFKDDILFFIEKIKHIQSFKSASKLMPFLLVDNLDKDTLIYLKENGVIIGFINELFGQKYAVALKELLSILNNAGASLKSNPDKYLELIGELKKYNEGLANNIRGTLFEFVVGHIHIQKCQNIEIGREIISDSGRHEMDVLAVYSDKIIIAECKALKQKVDIEMVEKWITKKIPAFKKWVLKQELFTNKTLEFEFWATGGFTEDATAKLADSSISVKKYKISFFSEAELRKKAIEMKNKKLKEALDNYFLNTIV